MEQLRNFGSMIIRQGTINDLQEIQNLNNELFELELASFDSYLIKDWPLSQEGREYFASSIENDAVFVAVDNDKVIGYILGAKADIPYYNFEVAELCNMCVNSAYRGQGIGKLLVNQLFDYYKKQGIDHFTVTASFKNESAISFYKKMGFVEANSTFVKF